MSIFNKEVSDALKGMGGSFLKGSDFEGDGLVLKYVGHEKVPSRYGAGEDSKIVERGILEEGEVFRFSFQDANGNQKTFDTYSFPFIIGMNQAEINEGDWLRISRSGKTTETRYSVEKTEKPEGFEYPEGNGVVEGF